VAAILKNRGIAISQPMIQFEPWKLKI